MSRISRFVLTAALIAAPVLSLDAQRRRPAALGAQAGDVGRVEFPVSCAPEAQALFGRAVAVLHSFWWEETPQAFGAVIAADASCAMAYWGLALHYWGNPFAPGPSGDALQAGRVAAERAASLGAPTPREQGFIAAANALYRNAAATRNAARLRAYSDTLARVYRDNPDDVEVALYYALSLVATASPEDTTVARQKQAVAILLPLFEAHQDHPGAAHYLIHATDSPGLAQQGLAAAYRYSQIAPAAPHAQHMPSHIFIRLGLWDETVEANRRSYDAGVAYMKAQGKTGVGAHEFHALDYMVYGHLQRGRDRVARQLVDEALAITEVHPPHSLIAAYNLTAAEARLTLERGDWLYGSIVPLRTDSMFPVVEMLSRFARGISAARLRDTVQADAEVAGLVRVEAELKRRGDDYWATVAGIKRQVVHSWVLWARDDTAGGLREARAAADREDRIEKHPVTPAELLPARELYGDMLRAAEEYQQARDAYLATLKREPKRTRSLFGAARAAELMGDRETARNSYREVAATLRRGDGNRREQSVAEAFLLGR